MPRGPRLSFTNAFHHVFNRGLNKMPVFHSDQDYHFFLNKLRWLKKKYDFSLFALILMPTHFHLSLKVGKIPISKILASLCTSYSMYFNRTYNHLGPIWQNRFKSILIENDAYFMQLAQYIYLNPVKDGLVADPLDYPYSTLAETVGEKPGDLLDEDIITLIGNSPDAQEKFKKFVYDGLNQDQSEIVGLFAKEEAIIGSNQFSTRKRRRHRGRS